LCLKVRKREEFRCLIEGMDVGSMTKVRDQCEQYERLYEGNTKNHKRLDILRNKYLPLSFQIK